MSQVNTMPVIAGQAKTDEEQQYLTFLLSGEMYAIGILNIQDVERKP
jgi:chemotaxis signal transduction protein